jgi:ketosteroid isomerase-like protein
MKAVTLAIALLGVLTVAHADDMRAQITAGAHKISAAMKKKDFRAMTKAMREGTTSDFKYTEADTTQTFDEMIANMKAGLSTMEKITICRTKVLNLKQKGDTVYGTMQHTMAGRMKGEDKKMHTMSFSGVSANTYRKEGGKWKMATMSWTSMKSMMDGKPVPGMGG